MFNNDDGKECFKCEIFKPYSEFYKHPKMLDGFLNKCKDCAKSDVKENRINNIEYYKQYDNERASNPDRVKARENYAKSEAGKIAFSKAREKYQSLNLIKRAAARIVNNAVRDKKLVKKYSCEVCNVTNVRIHGHHDDYAFPLTVRWLCQNCHIKWHKENGSGANG